ncbi:putative disease resistance protein RGA1 [Solanum tuberosum]|uniref:putative disease resistance protein RGA1 n=1 Tax=Solanum tuberosum TaxID=4113 RepID=UPI00073A24D6|nr:PREDICTED: putative disease resistance protein RGA1 [Solanum tuberosum]
MESEFVALELAGSEAEWLLAHIPLIKDVLPHVFIHCDCQAAIAIAKNKSYNCKSRHMKLRHDVVKQLLRDGIISIDYVKSEMNLAYSLTKPVGRKLILQIEYRGTLESLPEEGVKGLTSLTELFVDLKCVPEGLQHLTALISLTVR